jgi:hypothetical protein
MTQNNGLNPLTMQPNSAPAPDYKREALYWQQKYIELLAHTSQVIAELSRPMLIEQARNNFVQQASEAMRQHLAAHPPEQGQNVAQGPTESQESMPVGPSE